MAARGFPDFLDLGELYRWLREQPREVGITFAARGALRLLPTACVGQPEEKLSETALFSFRSAQISWYAARFAVRRSEFRKLPTRFIDRQYLFKPIDLLSVPSDYARMAIAYAVKTVELAGRSGVKSKEPIIEIYAAIPGALGKDPVAVQKFGDVAASDALLIEDANNARERVSRAHDLAGSILWPAGAPQLVTREWRWLKAELRSRDEGWEIWIDWYENRLAGRGADKQLELACATLPEALWRDGPSAVNAELRRLLDQVREHAVAVPEEAAFPGQSTHAAIFQPNSSGVLGVAPPVPQDRLADSPEVHDFYKEVREKLEDLISLGRNMLGERLYRSSDKLRVDMPEAISLAIERRVWSSGNTLRCILAAHEAVADDHDPHPDKLERGATERLRDVVATFNQLAFSDPALRQRDANRPGPREHERSISEIKLVLEVAAVAAANRAITTSEAGDELAESGSTVIENGSALPNRLAVEHARDTHRNFFAGMVVPVYRNLRNIPELAQGGGGFISKEYLSGIYKAAGAATVAVAWQVRWEIVDLVISNADLLKLYSAYAFDQSPGFRQIVDWLEAHIQNED